MHSPKKRGYTVRIVWSILDDPNNPKNSMPTQWPGTSPWVDGNTIHEELPGVRIPRPEAVKKRGIHRVIFACEKPLKINMEPEKRPLAKGKTSTNQQFLGSMLIFRGVSSKKSFLWQFGSTPNLQWFQDIVPRCFCMLNKKMSCQVHHPSAHTWICVGVPVYSFLKLFIIMVYLHQIKWKNSMHPNPKSPEKISPTIYQTRELWPLEPPRKVGLCQDLWDAQTWGDDTSQR